VAAGPLGKALSGGCEVTVPVPGKVDPKGTNGFQPVWAGQWHVQTFKAAGPKVESIRLRLAGTEAAPGGDLVAELRDPRKPEVQPLARAVFRAAAPDAKVPAEGATVCRLTPEFEWQSAPFKAEGLEPGQVYELAFSSPEALDQSPWLVNCYYRDAYAGGEHRPGGAQEKKPAEEPKAFDLVFELTGGGVKVTSVPGDGVLPAKERAGLSHEGWAPGK